LVIAGAVGGSGAQSSIIAASRTVSQKGGRAYNIFQQEALAKGTGTEPSIIVGPSPKPVICRCGSRKCAGDQRPE